jgi:hypothetical protein
MSRLSVRAALAAVGLAAALAAGAAGMAGASSIESMLDGSLLPSAAPSLLGPITEAGRVGWACKPEKAAAAVKPQDAELPNGDTP